jgi:hypothetical protein
VRRGIAISLMMLFSWMLSLPFFTPDAENNLPPCCRRTGRHHCMMQLMEQQHVHFGMVTEKCPYLPVAYVALHSGSSVPADAEAFYAGVLSHPAGAPQTEARYRVAFSRSRQKRGPPSNNLI